MGNLLRFELRKLKRQKSFYICPAIMVAVLALTGFAAVFLTRIGQQLLGEAEISAAYQSSGVNFMLEALSGSSFEMIIGIFTAIFVCCDYENEIVKTIYAKGYSRKSVYASKMVAVWIAASIMFVVVEIFGFVFGTIFFGLGNIGDVGFIRLIPVQYLAMLAGVAMYYAISSSIRRMGFSIAVCIVAPTVVSLILSLADSILKLKNFSLANIWVTSLVPGVSSATVDTNAILMCVGASVIYILVFLIAGMILNKKNEL